MKAQIYVWYGLCCVLLYIAIRQTFPKLSGLKEQQTFIYLSNFFPDKNSRVA